MLKISNLVFYFVLVYKTCAKHGTMWFMAVNEAVNTGVIVRGQDGKFLPGTRAPGTIKSSEDARNLAQKRWDKARKAAVKRITGEAASIDPTVSTVDDAYGLMLAKQYTTILDSDKPRMDDAEKMGQLLGLAPRSAELRQEQAQRTASDPVGEALLTLIQALTGKNEVINGQVQIIDQNDASAD